MSQYPYYDVDPAWREADSPCNCGDGPYCDCDSYGDLYDDDDFPMSVEYDGLWGGSDWQDELTAQQEAEYERDFFGDDY